MRRWFHFVAGLVAAVASAPAPALGQEGMDWDDRRASLEAQLPRWMAEANVPGLAIAVVSIDSVWSRGFGVLEAGGEGRVGPETLFEAASLSKPVFARMVFAEVGRGTINLETPLLDYWSYPDLEEEPWTDRVTGRMVLSHRSGLPNWRRDQPLSFGFEPGTRFGYSGEGYVYLEAILAYLRGEPLEARVQRTVLRPLGMERSSFLFEPSSTDYALPHDSEGHAQEKRPAPPPGNPAASLHTTAADYGVFVQTILRETHDDPRVLAAVTDRPTPVDTGLAWGPGWGLEYRDDRPGPALWHWGDNGPFKAFVYLDPVQGLGFVFFTNSSNGLALTSSVLGVLFPGPHPLLAWFDYDQLDRGSGDASDATVSLRR
jgi:CubicO group peptidase (beta-lactamase class C family)